VFLFIFESIGTSEMLLVGVVALIFLGPRKLPEMAKKMGKIMTEFRGTANDFKETWQREVNFEEEAKLLKQDSKLFDLDDLNDEPIPRVESISAPEPVGDIAAPAIREADPSAFKHLRPTENPDTDLSAPIETAPVDISDENDKRNWL
jgi:Tat protein translocase TatB subunit